MTTIRFQADADLNQAIVTGVLRRQPTIDFQSAYLAGFEGKQDQDVLAIAAAQGRVLVPHDRKTMPIEFGTFIVAQSSAGVIVISQRLALHEAIENLILIWDVSTAEE